MPWAVRLIRLSLYGLFVFVPLIFLPWTSELFEFNKIIVTYLLTLIIAASWAVHMILEKRVIFRRTPLDTPLLIFLGSNLLSLLFSIDPQTSLLGYYGRFNGGLLSLLSYSVLYWAAVTFLDHRSALSTLYLALSTAALVSIYGILQHFGLDARIWVQDVRTRVFSTLGQPNWLAAYLVALIWLPISIILDEKSSKRLLLFYSSTLLLFITLLFTKSRSGLLAFGLSWLPYWGLIVWKFGFGKLKNLLVLGIWGLVIVMTLVIENPLRDLFFSKFLSTSHLELSTAPTAPALEIGGTESGTIRRIVWTGAIRIWRGSSKNILIGTGPETFAMSYYQYRPIEHNNTSEWELLYNKAHNEFLNYLANTGLLGLASYLVLLVAMFWNFKFQISNLPAALFSGWLSLSVTNFWGFSVIPTQLLLFLLPALSVPLEAMQAPADRARSRTPQAQRSGSRALADAGAESLSKKQLLGLAIVGSSTLLLFYSLTKYWLADFHYASAQKHYQAFSRKQDPQYLLSAYTEAAAAYDLNPREPTINSQLADTAAYLALYTSESDATASAQFAAIALSSSQAAINASPRHPSHYKSRSRILILLSALDDNYLSLADAALAQAAVLSPTDPRIPYNQAIIAKYQDNIPAAKDFLSSALRLKPDFAEAQKQSDELATASGVPKPLQTR